MRVFVAIRAFLHRDSLLGLAAVALAVQIAALAIMPVYITYDSAGMLHNMEHCRAIFRFHLPLFGYPLLGVLTGVGITESIFGLLFSQAALTIAVVFITLRVALLDGPATALVAGTGLIASLTPFLSSMSIMNDHLYLTLITAMIGCYAGLILTGQRRFATGLALTCWLAQHTRPTGDLLELVMGLAILLSLAFHPQFIRYRLAVIGRAVLFYLLLVLGYAALAFLGAKLFHYTSSDGATTDSRGRWLFCQIYSRPTDQAQGRISLDESPTAQIIAGAVRDELQGNPLYLKNAVRLRPELFSIYRGDGRKLAEDLVHNSPPDWAKSVFDQPYCWVIFNTLDGKFGADRANDLLTKGWAEIVRQHPDLWRFYARQAWNYYFNPPDERANSFVSNDIGPSIVSPRLYSQLYALANARQTPFTAFVYRSAMSFSYFVTPLLSALALFGLPLMFSGQRLAPVLVLLWGIVLYHGFATAIANVITMRYIVVIYPQLTVLAAIGLMRIFRIISTLRTPRFR